MTIYQYIEKEGMTLSSLADRVGVSRAAMTRYANGQRIPRPDVMLRLSVATDGFVKPNDFYTEAAQ